MAGPITVPVVIPEGEAQTLVLEAFPQGAPAVRHYLAVALQERVRRFKIEQAQAVGDFPALGEIK